MSPIFNTRTGSHVGLERPRLRRHYYRAIAGALNSDSVQVVAQPAITGWARGAHHNSQAVDDPQRSNRLASAKVPLVSVSLALPGHSHGCIFAMSHIRTHPPKCRDQVNARFQIRSSSKRALAIMHKSRAVSSFCADERPRGEAECASTPSTGASFSDVHSDRKAILGSMLEPFQAGTNAAINATITRTPPTIAKLSGSTTLIPAGSVLPNA